MKKGLKNQCIIKGGELEWSLAAPAAILWVQVLK